MPLVVYSSTFKDSPYAVATVSQFNMTLKAIG